MESFPICTTISTTANCFPPEFSTTTTFSWCRMMKNPSFGKKPRNVLVFASKDEPPPPRPPLKLDEWDQMELKFGKLIGEDPKLTLAKIMARKSDPDASYLQVEKDFAKKKGKFMDYEVEEIPLDASQGTLNKMNLVRPVPKKGVKFETNEKSAGRDDWKTSQVKASEKRPPNAPNVTLRKPSLYNEAEDEKSLPITIKPNIPWKMGKEPQRESSSHIALQERPKPQRTDSSPDGQNGRPDSSAIEALKGTGTDTLKSFSGSEEKMNNPVLLERPEPLNVDMTDNTSSVDSVSSIEFGTDVEESLNPTESSTEMMTSKVGNFSQSPETWKVDALVENESIKGLQPSDGSLEKSAPPDDPSTIELKESSHEIGADAALIGKPKRLDRSVKVAQNNTGEGVVPANPEIHGRTALKAECFLESPIKEREENDWKRAEDLVNSGGRTEVEVISSSIGGFTVSFGSLIGVLPYRNLAAKWKFLAFESWLRKKGLDPSKYKQNLGVIGSFQMATIVSSSESTPDSKVAEIFEGEISPDMKLEDLFKIYDQEKLKFLSSFVGQKIKVTVVLVDGRSKRLIFSTKPKEKEELVERKRNLMAKLNVGDVVKCCIKKITYFGVFVECSGVPALIHQTEVSWDATLDPMSHFKVGQIVDAKVHQLDFLLGRIFLSLKEILPDPMLEAMEAVVGDRDPSNWRLEAAEGDSEWTEVESLIKELQQVEGVQSVSKGRYFSSVGLAPTFQVYMAAPSENQYKLLARSGNKAQEVMVESTLNNEEMKSAILTCTNRVE